MRERERKEINFFTTKRNIKKRKDNINKRECIEKINFLVDK